mmetsp:Transcript_11597/g.14404  ORF Transcript_11597/g.14404 Transcript_11597/m.14404 type:complete len:221 (-) Transcript_11597:327-989(-)
MASILVTIIIIVSIVVSIVIIVVISLSAASAGTRVIISLAVITRAAMVTFVIVSMMSATSTTIIVIVAIPPTSTLAARTSVAVPVSISFVIIIFNPTSNSISSFFELPLYSFLLSRCSRRGFHYWVFRLVHFEWSLHKVAAVEIHSLLCSFLCFKLNKCKPRGVSGISSESAIGYFTAYFEQSLYSFRRSFRVDITNIYRSGYFIRLFGGERRETRRRTL